MTKMIMTEAKCTWFSLTPNTRYRISTAMQYSLGAVVWAASMYSLLR